MKNKSENILKILAFIKQEIDGVLFINELNEEVDTFYLYVIRKFAKDFKVNVLINNDKNDKFQSDDLFGLKSINLFTSSNGNKIKEILSSKSKNIIFTGYSSFKKHRVKYDSINSYNYSQDISSFLYNVFNIDNSELKNFCLSNPSLIYSEVSKYLINEKGYVSEISVHEKTNFLMKIRKEIYNYKNAGDFKNMFFKIKEELKYKKLSFLTY